MVLRSNPHALRVVQVAELVAKRCAALARSFQGPGALARADQLVRSSTSIPLNIVEGCGRGSVADYQRLRYGQMGSHVPGHRERTPRRLVPRSRSEEHTSELQSQSNLVCRLL